MAEFVMGYRFLGSKRGAERAERRPLYQVHCPGMEKTLSPRLDIVFKLLFADEHNRDLLVSLLNAILQPRQRIVTVEVVNPEVSKDGPDDRATKSGTGRGASRATP